MIKSVLILDEFFAMNAKIGTLFLSHINIVKYLTHRNTELLTCAVFTISNGKVKLVYHTFAGHRDFYRGKDYLLMVEAHLGEFASYKLTMPNGKIKEELLVCKAPDVPIDEFDYPEYSEPQIEFHFEDLQPLKDAFDVFSTAPAN